MTELASSDVSSDIDVIAAGRLRRDGQRYTTSRRDLVSVLVEHGPLTIPEILRKCPGLPQSSAYRNLAVLERSGVVRRIITSDEWARYELAEPLAEHHHHLICARCGGVVDFTVSTKLERALDAALNQVAIENRFEVHDHRLDLVGRCSTCAAEEW
ncbi:MAG TPA: Fur family transcriptional regulator [Acidimicrobiales bacterium]|nr:Fur family transcriptional regulator [Acidimicrobiales bacterium]